MDTLALVEQLADNLAADPDALAHLDLEEAVDLLRRVADAQDALRSVRGKVERRVLALMTDKEHQVAGCTVTRRTARKGEKWDNASILPQLVTTAIADRKPDLETGEIADPAWVAVQAVDRIYGITDKTSTRPRTKALAEFLGWDADELDEYRVWDGQWDEPTVQLTRPKREQAA